MYKNAIIDYVGKETRAVFSWPDGTSVRTQALVECVAMEPDVVLEDESQYEQGRPRFTITLAGPTDWPKPKPLAPNYARHFDILRDPDASYEDRCDCADIIQDILADMLMSKEKTRDH